MIYRLISRALLALGVMALVPSTASAQDTLARSLANQARTAATSAAVKAAAAEAKAADPAVQWATTYRGALPTDPITVMPSPPSVTMGAVGAISSISSQQTIDKQSALLTFTGNWQPYASDSAYIIADRTGGRISFMLTGPRVDVRIARLTTSTRGVSIFVDGQLVTKTPFDEAVPGFASKSSTSPARQWMQIDFGANTLSYKLSRVNIGVVGTGYAVGDSITIAGGTCTTAPVVRVAGIINSGSISNAVIQTPGNCSAIPNNPLQQASTSGGGTGAQFTQSIFAKLNTAIRPRRIDLIFDYGVMFGGLTIGPSSTSAVYPVPASAAPKELTAGDSITDYLNADTAATTWAQSVARRIGLSERMVAYGTAGRGWIASTPFSTDVAGIIAEAPDLLTIALGTNDALNAVATGTLTSTVTGHLNTILAALPKVRIVVVGPFVGDTSGAYTSAIAAGVSAASDQRRVRFIDFRSLGIYSETGPYGSMLGGSATDIHPTQAGHDLIASALAPLIGNAFQQMLLLKDLSQAEIPAFANENTPRRAAA